MATKLVSEAPAAPPVRSSVAGPAGMATPAALQAGPRRSAVVVWTGHRSLKSAVLRSLPNLRLVSGFDKAAWGIPLRSARRNCGDSHTRLRFRPGPGTSTRAIIRAQPCQKTLLETSSGVHADLQEKCPIVGSWTYEPCASRPRGRRSNRAGVRAPCGGRTDTRAVRNNRLQGAVCWPSGPELATLHG